MRAPWPWLLVALLVVAGCPPDEPDDDDATGADDDTGDDDSGDDDSGDDDTADDDTSGDDDTTPQHYPVCPTTIDVFGYSNVAFTFCGGFNFPSYPTVEEIAPGIFMPGLDRYDATLAGHLQARVLADPELTDAFGTDWVIRSCAVGGGTMHNFVEETPDEPEGCHVIGGAGGLYEPMCTASPADVILYAATNANDWCHGGGTDSPPEFAADDRDAFQAHWVALLERFVRDREPSMLVVSPQHEWHGQYQGTIDEPDGCLWQRPEWNRTAPEAWAAEPPEGLSTEPIFIGTIQEEFKRHHDCCAHLEGVSCADDSWFSNPPEEPQLNMGDGWTHFGCDGAEAVADFWFAELKQILLNNTFECP